MFFGLALILALGLHHIMATTLRHRWLFHIIRCLAWSSIEMVVVLTFGLQFQENFVSTYRTGYLIGAALISIDGNASIEGGVALSPFQSLLSTYNSSTFQIPLFQKLGAASKKKHEASFSSLGSLTCLERCLAIRWRLLRLIKILVLQTSIWRIFNSMPKIPTHVSIYERVLERLFAIYRVFYKNIHQIRIWTNLLMLIYRFETALHLISQQGVYKMMSNLSFLFCD